MTTAIVIFCWLTMLAAMFMGAAVLVLAACDAVRALGRRE